MQRGGNAQVATLTPDDTVAFRTVRVNTTDGILVNIAEGLKAGEKVAVSLPSNITEGAKVRPATR